MNRFFVEELCESGGEATLTPEESHHLCRVLRLGAGASVLVIDGKGGVAEAVVKADSARRCQVEYQPFIRQRLGFRLSVAFGLPKPSALDQIIRRCTEVGVCGFFPLVTDHSLQPKAWNRQRWEKAVSEVIKQCQSPFLPELHEPTHLNEFLGSVTAPLFFCDERDRASKVELAANSSAILLVGPEGGWSDQERENFNSRTDIRTLGLGANRLRTETAALVGTVLAKRVLGEV